MSKIVELMSGRALEHGIGMLVDHGRGSGSKMYVGGQANALVAAGTVINADDEGTTETETTSYTVPANTLVAGSTIRAKFYVHSPSANGSDTTQIALRFGANTTASSNSGMETGATDLANSGAVCVGDGVVQIRTAGASGTAIMFGTIAMDVATVGIALSHDESGAMATFAVDTTVANYLAVTITQSGSNAAQIAQAEAFIVDIVNPFS
jgi:hypothetical protein|tara:strand:+ start:725 stop:1351 length:627 start_codon:yes stop_codon:yes gene_type:complete